MKRDVTITADRAAEIARHIRDDVADCYRRGSLNEFSRGMYQGQMTMVLAYMGAEDWVFQGIRNETDFYCRRAEQAEMRSK